MSNGLHQVTGQQVNMQGSDYHSILKKAVIWAVFFLAKSQYFCFNCAHTVTKYTESLCLYETDIVPVARKAYFPKHMLAKVNMWQSGWWSTCCPCDYQTGGHSVHYIFSMWATILMQPCWIYTKAVYLQVLRRCNVVCKYAEMARCK